MEASDEWMSDLFVKSIQLDVLSLRLEDEPIALPHQFVGLWIPNIDELAN